MSQHDDEVQADDAGEDEICSGDIIVMLCDDGLVHGFRVLDDGIMTTPACGAAAKDLREAHGHDVVHTACVAIMAEVSGVDPGAVLAATSAVQAIISERKRS